MKKFFYGSGIFLVIASILEMLMCCCTCIVKNSLEAISVSTVPQIFFHVFVGSLLLAAGEKK